MKEELTGEQVQRLQLLYSTLTEGHHLYIVEIRVHYQVLSGPERYYEVAIDGMKQQGATVSDAYSALHADLTHRLDIEKHRHLDGIQYSEKEIARHQEAIRRIQSALDTQGPTEEKVSWENEPTTQTGHGAAGLQETKAHRRPSPQPQKARAHKTRT